MTPLFSLILATGRTSYGSLIHDPREHLLKRTLESLQAQTAKNFELVLVDSLYRKRNMILELLELGNWTFNWQVTHPNSWWLDNGFWALQNAFNTGFAVSKGKFLYFCGDCCEFPPDAMAKAQALVERGHYPSFLFAYKWGDKLLTRIHGRYGPSDLASVEDARATSRWNDLLVRDSRWNFVRACGGLATRNHCNWDLLYGYACVPREDFIHVNGFDENFDGEKSVGDVELGSRLHLAGHWTLALSEELWCYENSHNSLDPETFHCGRLGTDRGIQMVPVRSNYDLIYLMREKGVWRANSTRWSEEDCKRVIRSDVTNLSGWVKWDVKPGEPMYDVHRHWIENQPVFEVTAL